MMYLVANLFLKIKLASFLDKFTVIKINLVWSESWNYFLVGFLILVAYVTILFLTFRSIKKQKVKPESQEEQIIPEAIKKPQEKVSSRVETKAKLQPVAPKKTVVEVFACDREAFSILGKSIYVDANSNPEDVEKLWDQLGIKYSEIAIFAKQDQAGNAVGFWGSMSDETMSFLPWKDLKEGYYMAGVEVGDRIKAPKGWEKWTIPAFSYLFARVDDNYQEIFDYVINDYIPEKGHNLVGAVQEYNCPAENGQLYLFFPIKKL